MRPEIRSIAKRVNLNRLDWKEVLRANKLGWRIDGKTVYLTEWELEILRKITHL